MHELVAAHAQEIGVSAQTIQQMKSIEEAARPELERLHQAVRKAHEAERDGQGTTEQVQAAHDALRAHKEALRAQVSGLLTDEQKTMLRALARKGLPCHDDKPAG